MERKILTPRTRTKALVTNVDDTNEFSMEKQFKIPEELVDVFMERVENANLYRKNERQYLETYYYGADVNLPYDEEAVPFELYENIGNLIDSTHMTLYLRRMRQAKERGDLRIGGKNGEYLLGKEYLFEPERDAPLLDPFDKFPRMYDRVIVTASQVSTTLKNSEVIIFPAVLSSVKYGIAQEMTYSLSPDDPAWSLYSDK